MANVTTPALADIGCQNTPKGAVLCAAAVLTIPASAGPGIGELMAVCTIPKGAQILDSIVQAPVGVATMTVSLGDAGAAGRFISAAALGAGGACNRQTLAVNHVYAADTVVNLTFGVAAPTAAQVYNVNIFYKMS